jgi:hypothetical protein
MFSRLKKLHGLLIENKEKELTEAGWLSHRKLRLNLA